MGKKEQYLGYGALAATTEGGYVGAIEGAAAGAMDMIRSAAATGFYGITLVMASGGLIKTLFSSTDSNADRLTTINDSPSYAQAFLCGDYYLPLNIQFSVNAQKVTANSQLVDGINIVERIAKGPKIINCHFLVERAPVDDELKHFNPITPYAISTTYRQVESAPLYVRKQKLPGNKDIRRADYNITPLNTLTEMLNDLYENDDVFLVNNPVLNNELNVQYVYLQNYSITPQVGSTLFMVSMTMQEVNISDSVLMETAKSDSNTSGEIG